MFHLNRLVVALLFGLCVSLTEDEIAMFRPSDPEFRESNTGFQSQVYVTDNNDGSLTVTTNGIPSHDTWKFPHSESGNLNELREVWTSYNVFKEPIMRTESDMNCLPNGPIGISTSGAYIFGWWAAEKGCPYARDFEELDICEGHPSHDGHYHYHHYSPCVQMPVCGKESPIYGVALDGIPIYGPISDEGHQLTRADLDNCGGRYDSNGRYKYHVTADPPFFPSCFKGELRKDIGIPPEMFTCGCPYTDAQFPSRNERQEMRETGRRPKPRVGELICDFNGDINLPAVCNDIWNETEASLFKRKWVQVPQMLDLIPCCPDGLDCGVSCKTGDGIKKECIIKQRKVAVLTNVEKKISCWEACYDECYKIGGCNCKKRCKRQCYRNNGTSDYRVKREVEHREFNIWEKKRCSRTKQD